MGLMSIPNKCVGGPFRDFNVCLVFVHCKHPRPIYLLCITWPNYGEDEPDMAAMALNGGTSHFYHSSHRTE